VTVLVTGGSGLVGSHVITGLKREGVPVRALVRPASASIVKSLGAEPVPGDVGDADTWRRAAEGGLSGIVHAAAIIQGAAAPYSVFQGVNVGGSRLAVETARATGAHLVHVSSVAVYGGSADYHPQVERRTEDTPFRPIADHDLYARSKREAEAVVRGAAESGAIQATAIRPDVIYGERDRTFSPRLYRSVRTRFVPLVGPGTNHLPCVYAGNVAEGVMAALQTAQPGFRAYNITRDAPPQLTLREFLQEFAAACGRRVRFVPLPIPVARWTLGLWSGRRLARAALSFLTGENPFVTDRAERELGWGPTVGTRDAIARTVRWLMENEKPG
jgi:nucleoside-diphosphate-sugar epimerase